MSLEQLQQQILELPTADKQAFILNCLPPLAKEALQDSSFMMQLLPVFLGIVKDSGLDLQQLLQFAALHSATSAGPR
ncbi:hypothetical protein [Desulfuromonas thiophila]|jgi:hypothetical protein|uniref:Uncharacterized protein n=1 Tax=Desulfuromonas thiophila TaxID=57664 RepID=A0A1G6XWN6_9BACT|nr:hypothetical protein [Desulfuromonas thiophila]MDD3800979.1 hypothetical protein [Desulfuromonas thiophila]MDY0397082.1 hypothetical protein [Desulfuromonas thiophila]SDD81837.1 hypothetical protein SAMN05661003_101407 [Desulfuromonas thiophila]